MYWCLRRPLKSWRNPLPGLHRRVSPERNSTMPNVHKVMPDHVPLSTTYIDLLYLTGYLPTLQTGGQLRHFMHYHLG